MNVYNLMRYYWDYSFDNPSILKPNHTAIYFFAVEHCNRLGWKEKFGLPTAMVMEAVNIKSFKTYKNCFDDLCSLGFFKVIELSKNQYTANVIALAENTKAQDKALDKAIISHRDKQTISTGKSKATIDIPINNSTKDYRAFAHLSISIDENKKLLDNYTQTQIDDILDSIENFKANKKYKSLYLTAKKWLSKEPKKQIVSSLNSMNFIV